MGQVRERSHAPLECGLVADVQDHASCYRSSSVLPITFLRAVFTRAHNHVGDVLCIGDIARRKKPNFGQRVESRARVLFHRGKLKTQVSLLNAEARPSSPSSRL